MMCCDTVAWQVFRLPRASTPGGRLADFLALDVPERDVSAARVFSKVLRTTAVYRAHCHVVHALLPPGPAAREGLRQCARELVKGHDVGVRMLAHATQV